MKILVALFDRAIQGYGPVMTYHTRNEAIRQFRTQAEDKSTQIAQHPTDYELWHIADYNDENGEVSQIGEQIARAEDLIIKG